MLANDNFVGGQMSNILALITGLVLMLICARQPALWQSILGVYGLILFCTALILILSDAEVEIDLLRDYFNRGEK